MSTRLLARLQKLEAVLKPKPESRVFVMELDCDPADQEARIAAFKAEHDVQSHDVLVIWWFEAAQ
jgi:hypothetical protein